MNKNRNKSETTLVMEKMYAVAMEMASLAMIMTMHDIDDDEAWKEHGAQLMGASNILKGWGDVLKEKYGQ